MVNGHRRRGYKSIRIESIFSRAIILSLAKASGFAQRIRKLDPFEFFLSLSFGAQKSDLLTLTDLADSLSATLSRTGIHNRFSEKAAAFMQAVMAHFAALLKSANHAIDIPLLKGFSAVHIIDSSSWKLPDGLANLFPGYQGAGCKVQLMFDYRTSAIDIIELTKQTRPDQDYARALAQRIQTGALYLFDMGYAVADTLYAIDQAKAFFSPASTPMA